MYRFSLAFLAIPSAKSQGIPAYKPVLPECSAGCSKWMEFPEAEINYVKREHGADISTEVRENAIFMFCLGCDTNPSSIPRV